MKFLVDAQLPNRLCEWLCAQGHEALHTRNLPDGNRTSDAYLIELAQTGGWILVTKDDDFVQARLVSGKPRQLWLIATGNIDNISLQALLEQMFLRVQAAFAHCSFVELSRTHITLRD